MENLKMTKSAGTVILIKNIKGTYLFFDGDKYEGQWEDDLKNGQGIFVLSYFLGIMLFKSGAKYQGYWKDDVKSGHGKDFIYYF